MIAISLLMLFVLLTTNKHFVDDHLWGHVLKDHALKIFLWTLGALTFITVLLAYFDINAWVQQNQFASVYIILIAVLVGVIPESGPHLIFIILYMNGVVPFSILLANSIVQDGHGSLPLIADSKKTFFIIKGISVILGLIFGFAGFIFGF
ncbi:MAG: putative manganese transporter [Bacteroidales bacterium]